MRFRTLLPVALCAAISLPYLLPVPAAVAQDATASVLAERGELDKAMAADTTARISLLEKFLRDRPNSLLADQAREALVRSHATVGEMSIRNSDPKGASAAFMRALDSAGTRISDRLFSSVIWQMPVVLASAGYRSDAIALMKAFEPAFDAQASRLIQIGYFYVSIESPLDAVRVLERATELAPSDHRAFNSLGSAYIISLRLDDAANAFQKAIDLDPNEEFAYASLANLRRAFGNPTEAITLYKRQLDIKPDDPECFAGLAVSQLLLDDDAAANESLARALALSPRDFRLYTTLGYLYAARGRYEKAREMVELSLRIEPRFAWTHITLGNILLGQKKYKEAIEAFSQAQSYGDFPSMHFELAKAYMVDDQFSQAIDRLNASVDITDDGQFETRLGDIFDLRSSKLELLLERERQAVMFMPVQPTTATQFKLAESLARIGHYLELIPDPQEPAIEPQPSPAPSLDTQAPPEETKQEFLSPPGGGMGSAASTPEILFTEWLTVLAIQSSNPAPPQEPITVDPTLVPADAPLVFRPRRAIPPAASEPAREPSSRATEPEVAPEPEPNPVVPAAAEPGREEPAVAAPSDSGGVTEPAASAPSSSEPSIVEPAPSDPSGSGAAPERQTELSASIPDMPARTVTPELTPDATSGAAEGVDSGGAQPVAAEPSTEPAVQPVIEPSAEAGAAAVEPAPAATVPEPAPGSSDPVVEPSAEAGAAAVEPVPAATVPEPAPGSSDPVVEPAPADPSAAEDAARTAGSAPVTSSAEPSAVAPTFPFGSTAPAGRPEPPPITIVEDPASTEPDEPVAPPIRATVPESEPTSTGEADVRTAPVPTGAETIEVAPRTVAVPEPEPFSPHGRSVEPRIEASLRSAIDGFVGVDDGREPFRKIWLALQLADKGVLLDRAKQLAEEALGGVDGATELERSVRDMPDADRATRRAIMTARANDALGWVLFKQREYDQAIVHLTAATADPLADTDHNSRLWHLGMAKLETGAERDALDILIRAYQPASSAAARQRALIESVYVRVHGSTAGLDRRLGR